MRKMWTNPFKSMIPRLGDYDVNVLLEALKLRNHHVSLHVVFNPKVRCLGRGRVCTLTERGWNYRLRLAAFPQFQCRFPLNNSPNQVAANSGPDPTALAFFWHKSSPCVFKGPGQSL